MRDKAQALPDSPGVYIMKNPKGDILYIGKAKSLKHRVRSYFSGPKDVKTRHLLARIGDFEVMVTGSEAEALLLENNLIKRWKPKYNINLKDGKTYPVIKLTAEEFPRVYRTRRIVFDGSRYYGPYPKVGQIDVYLNLIDRLFPLRKCRGPIKAKPQPCFYYHIGRCNGVCAGKISREEYQKVVDKVRLLLSGKTEPLLRELTAQMQESAAAQSFERAAVLRDQIGAIRSLAEEQKVVDFQEEARDYVGFWAAQGEVRLAILQMRGGKLVGRDSFLLGNVFPGEEFLPEFLGQYYGGRDSLPQTVYLPASGEAGGETAPPAPATDAASAPAAGAAPLEEFLRALTGRPIRVRVAHRGKHARVLAMAAEAARFKLEGELERRSQAVAALQEALGLANPPRLIEGFDIAHLEGNLTVGSLVTFLDGQPHRSGYRHYHVRSLDGKVDDFEALREVVGRRYARQLNENRRLPDLVLIDGGKGQVGAAAGMLKALEMPQVPLVGLAKKNEEVFLPTASDPLLLPEASDALRLLQAVRDEAHRFATTFHKKLRGQRAVTSVLESVPGIGPKRARALLERFGGLAELRAAGPEAIAAAARVSREKAEELLAYLRQLP
jgi:excinuclease ABC subunit C